MPLDDLEGLVAFPSFHTAAGLLYIWAFWPLRLLRWPAIVVNCAMIATTPLGGAHYVIDLLAGAVVAFAAIAATQYVCMASQSSQQTSLLSEASSFQPSARSPVLPN